ALPPHPDIHHVTGFVSPKRIGHVIKVLDVLVTQANQNVTGSKPGALRRAAGSDAGQANSTGRFGHIGNSAQVGTVTRSTCGGRWRWSINEGELPTACGERPDEVGSEGRYPGSS